MHLGWAGNTGKVCAHVNEVDADLKMQVRRPPTVLVWRSERPDALPGLHTVALLQALEGRAAQVAIYGIEDRAGSAGLNTLRQLVREDDQAAVVKVLRVVGGR